MKTENQVIVQSGINTGRYKVESNKAYLLWNNKWRELGNPCVVSNHRRDSSRASVKVYVHELEYMILHGRFSETMKINTDLTLIPNDEVIDRPYIPNKKHGAEEITAIRKLHAQGLPKAAIARELNLVRTSVRYIIKKIESGAKLKFEAI